MSKTAPQPEKSPLVSCYGSDGNGRINVHVEAGDIVEWKQNGLRGSWRCRVLGWTATRLRILLLSHDGRETPGEWRRVIKPRVSRVFRNGERVLMP